MSASQFITTVPVFQGAQSKYYLVNQQKYHIRFPVDWAINHIATNLSGSVYESGPNTCGNCKTYGSIRNVFVGYCCNCILNFAYSGEKRGNVVVLGLPVYNLENKDMWDKFPYMYGVRKCEIGDEETDDITNEGVNIERLTTILLQHEEEDQGEMDIKELSDEETICDTFNHTSILSDDEQ